MGGKVVDSRRKSGGRGLSLMGEDSVETGDWKYLGGELLRRTIQPVKDVPFVLYVILAIIGLGGLGIWVELVKVLLASGPFDQTGLLIALATFFPALIGSSSLQLILASTGNGNKVLVSFALLICGVAVAVGVLINVFFETYPAAAFRSSIFFALIAVWLWWITNGDDPTYKSAPVDAPSGGDTDRPLKGDTSGFVE